MRIRRFIAGTSAATALFVGATAMPADAQRVDQEGLVNVALVDVVEIGDIQVAAAVPINVAAAICGVQVGIIAEQLQEGPVECPARTGDQTFRFTQVA
jgi:hypothetical protein